MMNIHDTAYTNTDEEYTEICNFLDRLSTQDPFILWESGRTNYWRYNVHAQKAPDDPFFRDNVHLWWSDPQELVGLCISEYGKNDLFVEVLPAYQHIYPAIFDWIEHTWATTRTAVEIDVFSNDAQKIQRLTTRGFAFLAHVENERDYDLDQVDLDYTLEAGFTIQRFSETRDYVGRVALVRSAFNNTTYTEANIEGLMTSPDYIDDYNLSVVAPDGQQVAYCIGWHDHSKENAGYIEPVGTHADYRRRGFAKAINRACFQRMKANGVKIVEIASRAEPDVANFLYDALGPTAKRKVHKYGKQVA